MTPRRAFSLIEVLIAILVLAFGLLGLGALFPVVISQQRQAADQMQGSAAAASVRATLFAGSGVVDWAAVAEKAKPPTGQAPNEEVMRRWVYSRDQGVRGSHKDLIRTFDDGSVALPPAEEPLPAAARLYPSPFGGVSPQFVWDVAVRRTAPSQPLEVALFVRRLDSGIRVPRGKTLSNVLTGLGLRSGGGQADPAALPVAVGESGRPTGNGVGDYATLRDVYLAPEQTRTGQPWDRCVPSRFDNEPGERPFLARRGQKLVCDNDGLIRTVIDVDAEGRLVVEPVFSNDPNTRPPSQWAVYAPQIPVSVEIIKVGGTP